MIGVSVEETVVETVVDGETPTLDATALEETATATVATTTVATVGTETATTGAVIDLVMTAGVVGADATEALVVGAIGHANPRKILRHTASPAKPLRISPASQAFCNASVV